MMSKYYYFCCYNYNYNYNYNYSYSYSYSCCCLSPLLPPDNSDGCNDDRLCGSINCCPYAISFFRVLIGSIL